MSENFSRASRLLTFDFGCFQQFNVPRWRRLPPRRHPSFGYAVQPVGTLVMTGTKTGGRSVQRSLVRLACGNRLNGRHRTLYLHLNEYGLVSLRMEQERKS